jgi:WD40 repeat protein
LHGQANFVSAAAITPDDAFIVAGDSDGKINVWDLATGRLVRNLEGHKKLVLALAVTPDGRRIVSGSWDHTVRVWDLPTGRLERTLKGHTDIVYSVAVTPDGARIASAGDQSLRIWDIKTGNSVATWTPDPGIDLRACCTVRSDAHLFVYGDSAGGVHVLRLLEDQKRIRPTRRPNNAMAVRSNPAATPPPEPTPKVSRRFGFFKRSGDRPR